MLRTFEAEIMKKIKNIEAGQKKRCSYKKKSVFKIRLLHPHCNKQQREKGEHFKYGPRVKNGD